MKKYIIVIVLLFLASITSYAAPAPRPPQVLTKDIICNQNHCWFYWHSEYNYGRITFFQDGSLLLLVDNNDNEPMVYGGYWQLKGKDVLTTQRQNDWYSKPYICIYEIDLSEFYSYNRLNIITYYHENKINGSKGFFNR